jgi:glutamate synthase (NADPH/NADH) small chain
VSAFSVAVLAGDGIGPEVTAEAERVLLAAARRFGVEISLAHYLVGAVAVAQTGSPLPPETRAADNPWPQWPKVYKLDYGQEEAAELWGADPRRYCVNTRRLIDGEGGRVSAIETVDIEWVHAAGARPEMRELAGTEKTLPADLVLIAMGFVGPAPELPAAFGCKLDHRGNMVHDDDMMTTAPGVFAAGDCARGQSLVVWAIREGRRAARGVDKFLMFGETVLPG